MQIMSQTNGVSAVPRDLKSQQWLNPFHTDKEDHDQIAIAPPTCCTSTTSSRELIEESISEDEDAMAFETNLRMQEAYEDSDDSGAHQSN